MNDRRTNLERITAILYNLPDSKVEYVRCLLESLFPDDDEDALKVVLY